jgi:predicted ferric reductase
MKKSQLGWIIVIALSVSPLLTWYFSLQPFSARFNNPFSFFTSLGQMASLVGFAMFSINLVLSTRLSFFEDYFGGMNRVYIVHHILGGIAFILLMIHPLLLASAYLTYSASEAAAFLLPSEDWARNTGIITLSLMMSILILTFYRTIPYHIWKKLHELLGFVFFIGMLHAFYIPSDVSRNPIMATHMFFFTVIGLAAFVYRTLLGRFFVRRYRYAVLSVRTLQSRIREVVLKPEGKVITSKPGQFLFISIRNGGITTEVHPFSISSTKPDGTLILTIKGEGDYTNSLGNVAKGAYALIEGGFGQFTYTNVSNKKQIWIAGGIGITPFYSMAQSLAATPDYVVDLYYSVHDQTEGVYLTEIRSLLASTPNVRFFPWITTVQGRLTADKINELSGSLQEKDFFICGPLPMMQSMRFALRRQGVKNKQIHTEEFSL